jgi:predicted Zn-dependent protease
MARQCIKEAPRAIYYDTLADVLATAKQYDPAIAALQSAVHMEPDNAKWHVNLAKLLATSGKPDQAKLMISELDLMTPGVRSLNDAYRQKLDAVRRQLNSASVSTTH